jgi:ELWxxDGT repeat protein
MKKQFTILLILFCSATCFGQNATLVKDLNPGTGGSFIGSGDKIVGHVGGNALFVINDNAGIWHLYSTDGTTGGTMELQAGASVSEHFQDFTVAGSALAYVLYNQSTLHYKLYTTNGTSITLLDKHPVTKSITNLHLYNDTLFYTNSDEIRKIDLQNVADSQVYQAENTIIDYYFDAPQMLYYSMQTTADDTLYLRNLSSSGEIKLGSIGTAIYKGLNFNKVNGKVVLFNYETDGNTSFYSTDGTAIGTILLNRYYGSGTGGKSDFYIVQNNKIYFAGMLDLNNPNWRGYEIWASDGTLAGTTSLYSASTKIDYVKSAVVYNNEVYFVAQEAGAFENYLYKTNGTQAGTVKVLPTIFQPYLDFNTLITSGGYLYLAAQKASPNNNIGIEIWKTDGTSGGTSLYETVTGTDYLFSKQLYASQTKIFFVGDESATGSELYLFTGATTTSIARKAESAVLSCYPNPYMDILNIDYKGTEQIISLRLRNITGILLQQTTRLDLLKTDNLIPGIYTLELETSNHIEVIKIQKK